MSPRSKTRLLLVLLVVAPVLGIGAAQAWPDWVWFLLPALVAGVFLATLGQPGSHEPASLGGAASATSEPPQEPPYRESVLAQVPLPSTVPGYPFLFSATVWWRTTADFSPASHNNPPGLAVSSVIQRAQHAVAAEQPSRCGYLSPWLDGLLGMPTTDESGLVTAFATGVRLTLRPTDQQRLDQIDEAHKSRGLWESGRQHELDRRTYLGEDVLRTPGSALVWWLSRHENDIERAVEMIGPLTCLSAAANDREVPTAFRHLCLPPDPLAGSGPEGGSDDPGPDGNSGSGTSETPASSRHRAAPSHYVSALLDEMGLPEGSADRTVFVDRLARLSEASGSPQTADGLRRDLLTDATAVSPANASSPSDATTSPPARVSADHMPVDPFEPSYPSDPHDQDGNDGLPSPWGPPEWARTDSSGEPSG
ncbi:hypothetical protein ACWDR0_15280 [Streptomyces sp. NPDC003691]